MFMQERTLRKCLADSGLTDVVKPSGRQYRLKHGKVLVEIIAAKIEPPELRRKVEREMRFNIVVDGSNALFNIIEEQQPDQAVIEAHDAARRQTAKRRDSTTVPAAETKLQGMLLTNRTQARLPRSLGLMQGGAVGTIITSVSFVESKVTSNGTAPKASRARR